MKQIISLFAFLSLFCLWGCGVGTTTLRPTPDNTEQGSSVANDLGLPSDLFVDKLEGDKFLTVFMIDIGQGDSFLIVTPNGKSLLVDSGPPKGRSKLVTFLRAQGFESLDALLFTHPDADHIGGAAQVIYNFPVKQIFDNGHVHASPQYEAMVKAIEKKGVPTYKLKSGDTIELDEGLVMQILAPPENLFNGTTRSDTNANTIVFRLVYGDVSFYFAGDSEAETEQYVLSQKIDIQSTVYKVAHHGSRHASQPPLLDAVKPRIALISASKDNRYGHPTPELLGRLEARNIPALKTLELGHVGLRTDGKKFILDYSPIDHIALFQGKTELSKNVLATTAAPQAKAAAPAAPAGPRANINCATLADLTKVKTIGERLGASIIQARDSMGGFSSEEELSKIKGLGKKRRELILQHFYVGPKNCSAKHENIPSALLTFPARPSYIYHRFVERQAA